MSTAAPKVEKPPSRSGYCNESSPEHMHEFCHKDDCPCPCPHPRRTSEPV